MNLVMAVYSNGRNTFLTSILHSFIRLYVTGDVESKVFAVCRFKRFSGTENQVTQEGIHFVNYQIKTEQIYGRRLDCFWITRHKSRSFSLRFVFPERSIFFWPIFVEIFFFLRSQNADPPSHRGCLNKCLNFARAAVNRDNCARACVQRDYLQRCPGPAEMAIASELAISQYLLVFIFRKRLSGRSFSAFVSPFSFPPSRHQTVCILIFSKNPPQLHCFLITAVA